MVYCLPVMMNIISNYYLYHLNVTEAIQTWSTPFIQVSTHTERCAYLGSLLGVNTEVGSLGVAKIPGLRDQSKFMWC